MFRRIIQAGKFACYSVGRVYVHWKEKGRLPRRRELSPLARKAFNSFVRVYLTPKAPPPADIGSSTRNFEVPVAIDPHEAWLEVNQPNARREQALREKSSAQTPKPIRTLMCAFNLNWEGAPRSQFELTLGLRNAGVIDPIVYSPTDGPLRKAYQRQGIQVRTFKHPLTSVRRASEYEQSMVSFAKKIEDWNVELVYGNTLQTFYAIDAAHRLRIPSVWNPRESDPWESYFDFLPGPLAHRALDCFKYPYRVVFVSNASLQVWRHLNSRHNLMVIHNGLNRQSLDDALRRWPRARARKRLGISPAELMVLLPGTVCERKGQIDLVEALAQISEDHAKQIKCVIVGNQRNSYGERLKVAFLTLPRSRRSRMRIIRETSDPALYFAAADIFVCSSRVESFPRIILEAMAAGLPIVTTPVFGITEQVQNNISALFYPPGDARALADAIARLSNDKTLRSSLAANAASALDSLIDFDSMVDAYRDVFREAWLSSATRARAQEQDGQTAAQAQMTIV